MNTSTLSRNSETNGNGPKGARSGEAARSGEEIVFPESLDPDYPRDGRATTTLRGAVEILESRGVLIGYSTLSEFLKLGDIAEQLGLGGAGNKREIHMDAVNILAAFLPEFRAAGGKTPQAPAMLRSFLKPQNGAEAGGAASGLDLVPARGQGAAPADPARALIDAAEAQGRAQGLALAEKVLPAQEAADALHISVSMLRKTVKPWRRFGNSPRGDRWLLSELLKG